MKRVLLTGSTGLIGSRIDLALKDSYEVICLARSGADITADLGRPDTIRSSELSELYAVVHAAGVTDEDFKERPVDAFTQSTIGVQALIDRAVAAKAERFVYISTSHVYGRQVGEIDEDSRPDPLSDYAIAHYAAEQTLKRNAAKFEAVTVLRPNAVFGRPVFIDKFDRWSLIPFSFPLEAVHSRKIVLRSSGRQRRNFVSTADLSRYVDHLLESRDWPRFEVMNAIGRETMSVYEFAATCARIYRDLSGDDCAVERPEDNVVSGEETFEYRTKFKFSLAKDDLESGIRKLMQSILDKYKNGKTFEA